MGKFLRAQYHNACDGQVAIVRYCGFLDEARVIIEAFGAQKVLVDRCHRKGKSFVGDSRSYSSIEGVTDTTFNDASLLEWQKQTHEFVSSWLAKKCKKCCNLQVQNLAVFLCFIEKKVWSNSLTQNSHCFFWGFLGKQSSWCKNLHQIEMKSLYCIENISNNSEPWCDSLPWFIHFIMHDHSWFGVSSLSMEPNLGVLSLNEGGIWALVKMNFQPLVKEEY